MGRNMALEQVRHLQAPFIIRSFQVAVLVYAQMAAVEEGKQDQEQEQGLYASRSFTYHAAVADVVRDEGKKRPTVTQVEEVMLRKTEDTSSGSSLDEEESCHYTEGETLRIK
jgi:hypothetical protein